MSKQPNPHDHVLSRLMRYVGRQRWLLAGAVLCALIGNIALLTAPRLVGSAIDLILPADDATPGLTLVQLLAVIGVLYVTGSVLNWVTAGQSGRQPHGARSAHRPVRQAVPPAGQLF